MGVPLLNHIQIPSPFFYLFFYEWKWLWWPAFVTNALPFLLSFFLEWCDEEVMWYILLIQVLDWVPLREAMSWKIQKKRYFLIYLCVAVGDTRPPYDCVNVTPECDFLRDRWPRTQRDIRACLHSFSWSLDCFAKNLFIHEYCNAQWQIPRASKTAVKNETVLSWKE